MRENPIFAFRLFIWWKAKIFVRRYLSPWLFPLCLNQIKFTLKYLIHCGGRKGSQNEGPSSGSFIWCFRPSRQKYPLLPSVVIFFFLCDTQGPKYLYSTLCTVNPVCFFKIYLGGKYKLFTCFFKTFLLALENHAWKYCQMVFWFSSWLGSQNKRISLP